MLDPELGAEHTKMAKTSSRETNKSVLFPMMQALIKVCTMLGTVQETVIISASGNPGRLPRGVIFE